MAVVRFFLLSILLGSSFAKAELRDLYRSARAVGMGGASVAIVDGIDSIWLNPAALGGTRRKEVHYFPLYLEASDDFYSVYQEQRTAFSSPSLEAFNALMGYNTVGRAQFTPGLMMRNFGFALIVDGQSGFYAKNKSRPLITFGYQNTNGLQAAFGFSLLKTRRGSRKFRSPDLRLGFGVKALWRRGGFYDLPLTTMLNLASGRSLIASIVGNYQFGLGVDLGAQYEMPLSRNLRFTWGTAFLDVGDTGFSGKAQNIEGNLATGLGLVYESGALKMTLAYDYRNILSDVDWRQRNNLGFEVSVSRIELQAGLHQSYLTAGVAFDLFFVRLNGGTTAEELGSVVKQNPNRRYFVGFDMKFDL